MLLKAVDGGEEGRGSAQADATRDQQNNAESDRRQCNQRIDSVGYKCELELSTFKLHSLIAHAEPELFGPVDQPRAKAE